MRRLFIGLSTLLCVTVAISSIALAQPPRSAVILQPAKRQQIRLSRSEHYQLVQAADRSRRARLGLITTAGVAAVGFAILAVGSASCDQDYYTGALYCDASDRPMINAGASIVTIGAMGVVITGVMLGVRNAKRRRLERQYLSPFAGRARWNLATNRLEF